MFLKFRCPSCRKRIKNIFFDYKTGMGRCTICHANYNLKQIFSINDIKLLLKTLKGEPKEKLIELFNLEEIPKTVKIRPWLYILFWTIFLIIIGLMVLILNGSIGKKISSILGIVIFAFFLTYVYKKETQGTIIIEKQIKNNKNKYTKKIKSDLDTKKT